MSPGSIYDVHKYRTKSKIVKCIILSDAITNTIPKNIDLLPNHHIGSTKRPARNVVTVAAKKACFSPNRSESSDNDDTVTSKNACFSSNRQETFNNDDTVTSKNACFSPNRIETSNNDDTVTSKTYQPLHSGEDITNTNQPLLSGAGIFTRNQSASCIVDEEQNDLNSSFNEVSLTNDLSPGKA